jgi:hypothetical protein
MFERYTDKARRVIFFARYEASELGSPVIESEFLLLGILREEPHAANRWLGGGDWIARLREEITNCFPQRDRIATSVDLPLSDEAKRVLGYAAEEAERLAHQHIGVEHLFLALLHEPESRAGQLLQAQGLQISKMREGLAKEPGPAAAPAFSSGAQGGRVPVPHTPQTSLPMPPIDIVVQESGESITVAWPTQLPLADDVFLLDRGDGKIVVYQVAGVEWVVAARPAESPSLSRVQIKVGEKQKSE